MADELVIYMELTDLVDTRLNTLELLGVDISKLTKWSDRKTDIVGGISGDLLYYIQRHRLTKEYIGMPTATDMINFINELIIKWTSDNSQSLGDVSIKIYINVYKLNMTTLGLVYVKNGLQDSIVNSTVEIVDLEEPSLEWVKDNIDVFISYYGVRWMNTALSNISKENYIPNLTLIVPDTLSGLLPPQHTASDVTHIIKELEPIINLLPVDIQVFSKK